MRREHLTVPWRLWVALAPLMACVLVSDVVGAPAAQPRKVQLTISITGTGTVSGGGHRVGCVVPVGGGIVPHPACSRTFAVRPGTIMLKAAAGATWKFTAWGQACRGSKPTCSLHIRRSTRVAATFVPPGDRRNPYALGRAVKLNGGWQIRVNAAILNADAQVAAVTDESGRPANDPPKPGAQYTLVNVTLTYIGGGSSYLGGYLYDQELSAEGAHNTPYQQLGCVSPPPDLYVVGDVSSGQSVTGDLCYEIASNDADSLMLSTHLLRGGGGRPLWFALR
jgi:hypothetical protein